MATPRSVGGAEPICTTGLQNAGLPPPGPVEPHTLVVNPPSRRLTRLLTGIAAAGMATTTLLTPTTSAQAAPAPDCSTERAVFVEARGDRDAAASEYADGLQARDAAKAQYQADPTRANSLLYRQARDEFAAAKRDYAASRLSVTDARSAYLNCQKPAGITFQPVDASQNTGRYVFGWTDMPAAGDEYLFINNGGGYGPLSYIDNSPNQGEVLFAVGCDGLGTGPTADFSVWTRVEVIYPQNDDPYAIPAGTKLAETTARNVCVPA